MSFFHFTDDSAADMERWTVAKEFWLYWAVAIPLTALTVGIWSAWQANMAKTRFGQPGELVGKRSLGRLPLSLPGNKIEPHERC